MRKALSAGLILFSLTAPVFSGTGFEAIRGGADTLMTRLRNSGAAGIRSAEASAARLPEPSAQRAAHEPELVKSLMVDLIEIQTGSSEEALKKFAETRKNLQDGGFAYVIGGIDSAFRVKIAYVLTKYVPVSLPVMQTFQILTNETKPAIDKRLAEAKANMADAGLSYIAAQVIQNPMYVDGWYDVTITYARK